MTYELTNASFRGVDFSVKSEKGEEKYKFDHDLGIMSSRKQDIVITLTIGPHEYKATINEYPEQILFKKVNPVNDSDDLK